MPYVQQICYNIWFDLKITTIWTQKHIFSKWINI